VYEEKGRGSMESRQLQGPGKGRGKGKGKRE